MQAPPFNAQQRTTSHDLITASSAPTSQATGQLQEFAAKHAKITRSQQSLQNLESEAAEEPKAKVRSKTQLSSVSTVAHELIADPIKDVVAVSVKSLIATMSAAKLNGSQENLGNVMKDTSMIAKSASISSLFQKVEVAPIAKTPAKIETPVSRKEKPAVPTEVLVSDTLKSSASSLPPPEPFNARPAKTASAFSTRPSSLALDSSFTNTTIFAPAAVRKITLGASEQDSQSGESVGQARTENGSLIVTALVSFTPEAGSDELEFEQDDVLLITDCSNNTIWKARHQVTGKTGTVKASMVQRMESFFADIVAMSNYEDDIGAMKSPRNRKLSGLGSDTGNADGDSAKRLRLGELSRSSRFNISVASEMSSGGTKRSRTPTLDDSWTKRVGEDLVAIISKEEKKRQEGIHEYVETEKGFVDDMEMVLDSFLRPLRESHTISKSELAEIFSNLTDIVKLCSQLSKELVTRQYASNGVLESIGDILLAYIPQFKIFAPFCSNLSHALPTLVAKKTSNAAFAEQLAECSKNKYFGNMDLSSFLLKPMQRITKIPLLIKGVLKHTAVDHSDFEDLTKAVNMSEEILLFINVKCGEADERRKLLRQQFTLDLDLTSELGLGFLSSKKREIIHGGKVECSDKKVQLHLFEDCITVTQVKTVNKSERQVLYKPLISLWSAEISQANSSEARPTGLMSRKNSTPVLKRGSKASKDPTRTISISDSRLDQSIDLVFSTAKECDNWYKLIDRAQSTLLKDSQFELLRLKQLPSTLVAGRRKPAAIDFKWSVTVGDYFLFSNIEGVLCTKEDATSSFEECPAFNNIRIGQIVVEPISDQLLVIEDKGLSMEAYPLAGLRNLMVHMFDENRSGNPPGLKLTKISGTKNVDFFRAGLLHDAVHMMTASAKMFNLYQFNSVSKFFKKVNEYPVSDGSNCHSITFLSKHIVISLASRFFMMETKTGEMKEIADSSVASTADMVALDCFKINDSRLLLCYDSMGMVVELGAAFKDLSAQKTVQYLGWQSTAIQFGFAAPYLKVFGKHSIEVYNIETSKLCFFANASCVKALDVERGVMSMSETETGDVLCVLSKKAVPMESSPSQ